MIVTTPTANVKHGNPDKNLSQVHFTSNSDKNSVNREADCWKVNKKWCVCVRETVVVGASLDIWTSGSPRQDKF